MTHLTQTIDGSFIGQFRYSWNAAQVAGVTFEQIAELAFGRLTNDPIIQMRWQKFRDAINENPDMEIKLIIDAIRIAEGREPAIEPVIEQIVPEYWVLTPAGTFIDLLGNLVKKIRLLSSVPLRVQDVELLRDRGHEVTLKAGLSLDAFLSGIEDPIAFVAEPKVIINEQPITLFADGSTSPTNDGVFENHEAAAIQSAEDYINQVKKEDAVSAQVAIMNEPEFATLIEAPSGGTGLLLLLGAVALT